MLVFNSEETFESTVELLDNMSVQERKIWEENLGFKSYDRLIHEIIDAEIAYTNKFENLPEEDLKKAIESGAYQEYSPYTQKFIKKGIVIIRKDEKGEEYMGFQNIAFSKLVDENGFFIVEDEIRQFTENKYKVIKSKDFSKIEKLKSINECVDNKNFFISNINTNNKSLGVNIDKHGYTYTNNRSRGEIFEYARTYKTWTHSYRTYYDVKIYNWKKNWRGKWKPESARTWFSGNFKARITYWKNEPPYYYYVTKDYSEGKSDVNISYWGKTVFSHSWYDGSDNVSLYGPTFPTPSLWWMSRWGGSSGLKVKIVDHWKEVKY